MTTTTTHAYEFKVADNATLLKMWVAGNGEFYFKNLQTSNEFSVRMSNKLLPQTARKLPTEVKIDCCVIKRVVTDVKTPSRLFIHIGKYNFAINKMLYKNNVDINMKDLSYLIKCFRMVNEAILTGRFFNPEINVWFNGHCARCGKELTNNSSIIQGFGDECKAFLTKQVPVISGKLFI